MRLIRSRRAGRGTGAAAKRLPHAALLLLAAILAAAVIYLTWPQRSSILCEQLPELAALAVCAATLLVFSFRALSTARATGEDLRIAGSAAILAALAFFLSARYLAEYRQPCVDVQRQLHPSTPTTKPGSR